MSKILNQLKQQSTFASQPTSTRPSCLLSTFRLLILGLLLIFSFLTLNSCGLDVEDPTPPSPPQWVEKSLPEEWPERGIDAYESHGIYLEWIQNPEDNVMTYIIFRSHYFEMNDSLGEYEELRRIENEIDYLLKYLDSEVTIRTDYFYKLKALDNSNNYSGYSDSVKYSLLPALPMSGLSPNGISDTLNANRKLFWSYSYQVEMEDYCLTLLNQKSELVFRILLSPTNYVDGFESWRVPDSVIFEPNQIYKWRIDTEAKYSNGLETAGSESNWAPFVYSYE